MLSGSVRIGVPVRLIEIDPADRRVGAAQKIFEEVVGLVAETGAEVVRIVPSSDLEAVLESCDGFVLPGGGDVDPALYGGPSDDATLFGVNSHQDELDARVIRFGIDERRPLLGLCRGMQLLNVVEGGSLFVDFKVTSVPHLAEIVRGDETVLHEVDVVPGTLAAEVHGHAGSLPVHSSHHQAVDRLGSGLKVSARTDDGCVEAIEAVDPERWTLGIQWHPEVAGEGDVGRHAPFAALRSAAEAAHIVRYGTSDRPVTLS